MRKGTRRRKIGCDKLALIRAVQRLPERVPSALTTVISQQDLDRARDLANEIEYYLGTGRLVYDYAPVQIPLHGCYGSRQ